LTNEAPCKTPLKVTDEEAIKPLPLIVSVNEPVPAPADDGDRLVIEGCGLGEGGNG